MNTTVFPTTPLRASENQRVTVEKRVGETVNALLAVNEMESDIGKVAVSVPAVLDVTSIVAVAKCEPEDENAEDNDCDTLAESVMDTKRERVRVGGGVRVGGIDDVNVDAMEVVDDTVRDNVIDAVERALADIECVIVVVGGGVTVDDRVIVTVKERSNDVVSLERCEEVSVRLDDCVVVGGGVIVVVTLSSPDWDTDLELEPRVLEADSVDENERLRGGNGVFETDTETEPDSLAVASPDIVFET